MYSFHVHNLVRPSYQDLHLCNLHSTDFLPYGVPRKSQRAMSVINKHQYQHGFPARTNTRNNVDKRKTRYRHFSTWRPPMTDMSKYSYAGTDSAAFKVHNTLPENRHLQMDTRTIASAVACPRREGGVHRPVMCGTFV